MLKIKLPSPSYKLQVSLSEKTQEQQTWKGQSLWATWGYSKLQGLPSPHVLAYPKSEQLSRHENSKQLQITNKSVQKDTENPNLSLPSEGCANRRENKQSLLRDTQARD